MKITKYVLALILSILFIASCSHDPIADEISPQEDTKIESRQWTVDFRPFDPCSGPVSVYIEPCFIGTGYEPAIPASLDMVMDVSSVEFVIVNNPNADLVFQCNSGGGACGQGGAFLPSGNGTIGGPINLVINPTGCPCDPADLDLCFYIRTAAHELMHVLGVVHNEMPGFNYIHVPGTPYGYEPGSLMNSGGAVFSTGNWCTPTCTFTDNDIAALDYLYPSCGACEDECPTVVTTKTVNSNGNCKWNVEMETSSLCQYYYDIRYPASASSSIGNTIPDGLFSFDTDIIRCGVGPITITIYHLDANGNKVVCEIIELFCCDETLAPCGGCPVPEITKIVNSNGCCSWNLSISNSSS